MAEPVRLTMAVTRVLAVFLADPTERQYGLELMRQTGQPSGTLYPILNRLLAAQWLRAEWEEVDPVAQGRPARRYYLLTPDGATRAQAELADLYRELHRARRSRPIRRPAAGRTARPSASQA
jgi:PadR family transcriptional regulator